MFQHFLVVVVTLMMMEENKEQKINVILLGDVSSVLLDFIVHELFIAHLL